MDNKKLPRQYHDKKRTFDHLETEALYIIRKVFDGTDIKLHSIASRVKEVQSFLDKVDRIQCKRPFEEIHDIVGVRVICLFLSDIERIGAIIRDSFSVLSEDNKIEGSEVSSFGYMSVHFIAMMKKEYAGPRYDHIANTPFEIQVRTIAMDAWANVSHYLEYKSETDVPTDLRRDFYALSGLFYVADKHFEMFFRSRSESRQQLVDAFEDIKPPLGQEINLDNLGVYLKKQFPDRSHADAKALSELNGELSDAGIKYIGELDAHIARGSQPFEQFEKDQPADTPTTRFSDVGFVRGVLHLTSDAFRKVRTNKGFGILKDAKKYQAMLK